ncbi:MAG: NUDIX domain-containing protein [Anaerolineales bacterium]|nr:NUDIX domain-containing protein [Anaerolineales bacterium]MCX7609413.1 NUDIX domain-containing protein [Anaerolineales bacterium]MDW8227118.1 NUDIX domain-containing protein [Anaerolineales bacterium]
MPALEQGLQRERYMVVPRVLIFVTRGNQVLLLRGAPDKPIWPNRYNGLGGHVEPGEDVLGAARRELFEEAGIEADLRLCGTLLVDTGRNPGVAVYILRGEYWGGTFRPSSEGSLEWVDWEDVSHLPCVDDVPLLLARLWSMKPNDPPFSARSFYTSEGKWVVEFAI